MNASKCEPAQPTVQDCHLTNDKSEATGYEIVVNRSVHLLVFFSWEGSQSSVNFVSETREIQKGKRKMVLCNRCNIIGFEG